MADAYAYYPFVTRQAAGGSGSVAWATDTIRAALVGGGYVPDFAAHEYASSLADEVAGDGYVRQPLTGISVAFNLAQMRAEVDVADAVQWTLTALKTFRYAVILKDTGVAATSPLIALFDFGAGGRTESGQFALQFGSAGLVSLTVTT